MLKNPDIFQIHNSVKFVKFIFGAGDAAVDKLVRGGAVVSC